MGAPSAFANPGWDCDYNPQPGQLCPGGGGGGGGGYLVTVNNRADATSATVSVPYSFQYDVVPTGSTFALNSGTLPPGLTLSTSGAITGTPTAAGTFNYHISTTPPPNSTEYSAGDMPDSITVQPAPVPSAPTNVSASVTSATAVHVTWNPPSDSGRNR